MLFAALLVLVSTGAMAQAVKPTVGGDMVAGSSRGCGSAIPHDVPYARIETGVAEALARQVAFRVSPLRVVSTDGRGIVLSCGAPLLPLGAQVSVAGHDGRPQRYRVVDATPASADADPVGDAVPVAPGAIATIIEDDDPAANARRFRKVELP